MLYLPAMTELLFGTAGIPVSARGGDTAGGVRKIKQLGLGCMEIEFVQKVYLNKGSAPHVAETAENSGVRLSAHAPYYINLNAHDPKKRTMSQGILHHAASIAALAGAGSLTFHAAFYLGDPPKDVFRRVKESVSWVQRRLKDEGTEITLRPEVSGKESQFGSVGELLDLCSELPGTAPTIDFSHWHARRGGNNSYEDFSKVLEDIIRKLGEAALGNMHIHVSGIVYGASGERRHIPLQESDMNYKELMKALYDYKTGGLLICESPNLEKDALLLKQAYQAAGKGA